MYHIYAVLSGMACVVDSFFYKNTYGRRLRKATELEEQEKEATIRQPN